MSLCREVLAVMDVIMPGRARKRGGRDDPVSFARWHRLMPNWYDMTWAKMYLLSKMLHWKILRHDAVRAAPAPGDAGQPTAAEGTFRGGGQRAEGHRQKIPQSTSTYKANF